MTYHSQVGLCVMLTLVNLADFIRTSELFTSVEFDSMMVSATASLLLELDIISSPKLLEQDVISSTKFVGTIVASVDLLKAVDETNSGVDEESTKLIGLFLTGDTLKSFGMTRSAVEVDVFDSVSITFLFFLLDSLFPVTLFDVDAELLVVCEEKLLLLIFKAECLAVRLVAADIVAEVKAVEDELVTEVTRGLIC